MILTCPECATSYFVDDARVPKAGRTVKCSHCGAKWTAVPETPGEAAPAGAATETAVSSAPAADDLVVEGPASEVADEPEAPRARKIAPAAVTPRPEGKVIVLAVTAGVVAALIAGLLVFRNEVVRVWPASSRAFTTVGLHVNEIGLVIEQVQTQAAFQGGRPVLSVTGQVRNIRSEAILAPALRVNLLDIKGKPLAAKIAQPINGRVPGKAIRHFAIAIVDPPANVSDLVVTFDSPGKASGPPARAAAAQEPLEAKPLSPGSPDALPAHD
jgi:predicted Zn finger-like uncharacterized protein